jgi:hypothetical protein
MGVIQRISLAEFSKSYIRSRTLALTAPVGISSDSVQVSENSCAIQISRGMSKSDYGRILLENEPSG